MKAFQLIVKDALGYEIYKAEFDKVEDQINHKAAMERNPELWNLPRVFSIVTFDKSSEIAAIEAAKLAKDEVRNKRLADLKAVDLSKVTTIAQIKPIIAMLLAELTEDK